MIAITKNELSILCRIASIMKLPIINIDLILDEEIIENTLKDLETKNITKDKGLTNDGEYIVRTLSMIEECSRFARINNIVYCLLSNNRYGLIIESDEEYAIFNLAEDAALRIILLFLINIESLMENSYKRGMLTLDKLKDLIDDVADDKFNISINYDENNITTYSILFEKDGKLNNIIADRNVIEEYGTNNIDKLINKSFKYLKGE